MTPQIPKRTLTTLMNALSSGVVPRRGLEYIAVGRKKETQTFVDDLEDTAEGGGAFRFISGRFGNGKSFMTQMVSSPLASFSTLYSVHRSGSTPLTVFLNRPLFSR